MSAFKDSLDKIISERSQSVQPQTSSNKSDNGDSSSNFKNALASVISNRGNSSASGNTSFKSALSNVVNGNTSAQPSNTFDYGKLQSWLDGAYNSLMSMDGYLTRNNGKTPEDATPWDDQTNARYSEWITRLTNQANDYLGQLRAIGDDSNQAVIQSYIDYMQGTQDTEDNPTSVGIKQFLDRERQANTAPSEEEIKQANDDLLGKYRESQQQARDAKKAVTAAQHHLRTGTGTQEELDAAIAAKQAIDETNKTMESDMDSKGIDYKLKAGDYAKMLGQSLLTGIESAGLMAEKTMHFVADALGEDDGLLHEVGTLLGITLQDVTGDKLGNDLVAGNALGKEIAEDEGVLQAQRANTAAIAKKNKTAEDVAKYSEMVGAAVPYALMAMLTSGGSTAGATAASLGATAAQAEATGLSAVGQMLTSASTSVVKDPNFVMSFTQQLGYGYYNALADGATDSEAALYALVNGYFNALVETGGTSDGLGGIQKLPKNIQDALAKGDKSVVMQWIKSIVVETGEEVVQGSLEQSFKTIYGRDMPILSATDENAVFSGARAKEEAKGAAIVATVLGGAQAIPNALIKTVNANTVANNATPTETPINAPTSNDNIQPSNDTPTNTQANTESLTEGFSGNTQNAPVNNKTNPFTHTTIDGDGKERVHGFSQPVDSMEAELHKSLEEDAQTYNQKTNAKTMEKAAAIINKGYAEALDDVKGALYSAEHDNQKLAPEIVPCVRILANQMVKNGDVEGARTLIKRLSVQLTEAGQLGQASRIIRNVTMGDYFGDGGNAAGFNSAALRLEFIRDVIEDYNKTLTRWQVGKINEQAAKENGASVAPGNKALLANAKESVKSAIRGDYEAAKDVIMPPKELLAEYANATTDEASDAALDNIMQYVADNTPTTFIQKFNALRYLNMLGNLKTQVRNLAGNTVMGEVAKIKRRVQATLNYALTGEQTQAIFVDSKAKKVARDYSAKFMDDMMDGSKYSDYKQAGMRKGDFARGVSEKQRVFDSNLLEAWRKATDYAMTKGDEVFISATFSDAFAGYLQSHGVKLTSEADIDALPAELRNNALEYAMKEASESAFHDKNTISDAAIKMRFKGDKVAGRIGNVFLDGLMPFRKTPANILVRAEEYSPLGIINTAIKAAQVASGKEGASVNDVVNSLSKSLTGTGILAAGMAMAAQGLAKGASGDDDEAEKYESQIEGKSDYSVKIGDKWVTADWAAPASIPFFMGAELYEILKDGWTPESATKLLGAVTDPMLEMSMLSGVNDAMSNLSSWGEDSDAMPKFLVSLGISYLSQAVGNTLLGQIESSLTPNRQETVYDKDSPFTRSTQMAIGKVANKIPGIDFQQEDYIDAWGNKQSNYTDKASQGWNAAENILSPAYTKSENVTEFDDELMRLHTALSKTDFEGDVLPEHTARSTKVGDTVLSNEEYTVYATKRGQESRRLLEDFLDSAVYKQLSDEERGEVIKGLLGMAKESAKADVMAMRGEKFDGTYTDVQEIDNPAEYLALKYKYNKAVKGNDYSAIDALVKASYSDKTAKLAAEKLDGYSKIKAAAAKGIDSETWFAAKDTFNKQNSNKDIKKSQADTNYKALIDSAPAFKGLTDKQKQYLKDEHPMFQMTPVNDDKYYTLKDKDLPETVIAAVISQKADMPSEDSFGKRSDYINALFNVLSNVSDNFEEDRKIIGAYTNSSTGQANFTNWLLYESGYTDEQQETLWDDFMASQGKTRTWKSAKRKYG